MTKRAKPDILKRVLFAFSRVELANQALSDEFKASVPDVLQVRQWEKLRKGFEAEIFEMLDKGDSQLRVLRLYALLDAINQAIAQRESASPSHDLILHYYLNMKTRCSKELFGLLTPLRLDYNLAA
ncbi:MAG: hypothetical protein ACKVUS_03765 [Saprospiraceae bacterium]